jgi:hypothetical protein
VNNFDEIRARLKQLRPTPGYSWWWDEDQWALLLHDGDPNNADDEGYIAIVQMKSRKWGIKVLIGEPSMGPDGIIFLSNSLEEAKHKVDMLLGWDSGEIPLFGNSDPR